MAGREGEIWLREEGLLLVSVAGAHCAISGADRANHATRVRKTSAEEGGGRVSLPGRPKEGGGETKRARGPQSERNRAFATSYGKGSRTVMCVGILDNGDDSDWDGARGVIWGFASEKSTKDPLPPHLGSASHHPACFGTQCFTGYLLGH